MTFALMQPYFFPYLGYFALVAAVDRWIVFDQAQYMKGGWIARNRILRPNAGWQYITVPVRHHSHKVPIHEVRLSASDYWRKKLPSRLEHYRKHAPHFEQVTQLLKECLENVPDTIAELNVRCLARMCSYIGIPFRYDRLSSLDLYLGGIDAPGDWAWKVGQQIEGTKFLNPAGGRAWHHEEDFRRAGIGLEFLTLLPVNYLQGRAEFEPNLSIIDVAMFNSPEQIRALLQRTHRERVV